MLELLHIEDTESLVEDTNPIENVARKIFQKQPHLQGQIQGWYRTHGIKAGMSEDKKNKLTELLSAEPHLSLSLEYRTFIWGFSYEGHKLTLGSNVRGTMIELGPRFPQELIKPLLKEIRKKLINPSFRDEWIFTEENLKDL